MPINDSLVKAAEPLARAVLPREAIDTQRRVERAIDQAGRVINRAQPFIRLQSPDGSVWRVSVDNAGALQSVKEVL